MEIRNARPWAVDRLPAARRFVPAEVRLGTAGAVEWRGEQFALLVDGGSADGALRAFIALADEYEPESFVEFARTWGVLGVCTNGLRGAHDTCDEFSTDGMRLPSITFTEWRTEPISAWRARAQELRAFLRLAVKLQQDMMGAEADWAAAVGHLGGVPIAQLSNITTIEDAKELLASSLSLRINEAGIVPALKWPEIDTSPSLYLRFGWEQPIFIPDALYAVLVAQLVAAVSIAIPECSNCGEPCAIGPNERLLRRDRRVFCSDKCRDIVDRERKRVWATKRRNTEVGASPRQRGSASAPALRSVERRPPLVQREEPHFDREGH